MQRLKLIFVCTITLIISSCSSEYARVRQALRLAGDNRTELEAVLEHYRDDPEKLAAARFLIANMPAHYSYADTTAINRYYDIASEIIRSGIPPERQRDTLRHISDRMFPGLSVMTVPDVRCIKSHYLIYSIDHAFRQWKERPWARHLSFDEFVNWLLPYKEVELQSQDCWRDTLSAEFSDSIMSLTSDETEGKGIYGVIDIVRDEITRDRPPRVLWEERSGLKLLSASTLRDMTFGTCQEYVAMGVLTFRSLGLPAVVDRVPVWGRNREGHSWFTFLSDQGREVPTMNSLIVPAGIGFYPYERCPKVFRSTYAINLKRLRYRSRSRHPYPLSLCEEDVTDHYYRTSDVEIPLRRDMNPGDRYACIATFIHSPDGPEYRVLDFGRIRNHKVSFSGMGRNVMYIAVGYDGRSTFPLSDPFIICSNGEVRFPCDAPDGVRTVEIRRKYYQSANVVEMRRRLLGSSIQYADCADFSDSVTVWKIEDVDIPDRQALPDDCGAHRFWRYLGADGTYGSIAELSFFDKDTIQMSGIPIADRRVPADTVRRAFDDDRLTNFESGEGEADDVWVGMDFGEPRQVRFARVVPRSDDNDICPGNEYELLWWDRTSHQWASAGRRTATDNVLHYDSIPSGALLWLRNHTRGTDERPFLIDESGHVEWW